MTNAGFINALRRALGDLSQDMQTSRGEWAIKGFIDIKKKIYTMSGDTKLISKVVELCLYPRLAAFAKANGLTIETAREQNFYPDLSFRDANGRLFALDLKSSYRKTGTAINGMTLGAFTGYFRDRKSIKNTMHPYGKYSLHAVLGIIYSPVSGHNFPRVQNLANLDTIQSVLRDFAFFVQEKWKIASDRPGSGNTKNIGSITRIPDLIAGNGPFATLGESVFDDYWMNYLTRDMAARAELQAPYYRNLAEYRRFKKMEG